MRRERFMREAAFLKTCNHPSILTQYDFGIFTTSKEEFPFIVTNYMPETLNTRIASNSLSSDLKIKFSCQLLSAVAFLQNRDIIHRDIKPSNIFISNETAILGDFGLIKRISAEESVQDNDDVELVNETVMNGFSGYAAMAKYYRTPELVNYANRTDRLYKESDIFQLGLVLAEMFTGKNPLRPSENIHDNIELDRIGYIDAPNGGVIFNTLSQMLELDRSKRISIDLAMDRFTGIYPE